MSSPPNPPEPPKWKTAVLTLLGIYPLILVVPPLLEPVSRAWPEWLSQLLLVAVIVGLMTWGVMPLLMRVFNGWLAPANGQRQNA